MISLYINTADIIQVGLLDEKYSWLEYKNTKEVKASEVLHSMVHSLLNEKNISLSQIKNVFTIAGPGSYTGLRLGEGFAQTLSLVDIKHYSFYLTDVFSILNMNSVIFYSNAFKREMYLYSREGLSEKSSLIKNFSNNDYANKTIYTLNGDSETLNISNVIYQNSQSIFSYIEDHKMKKEIYYYRSLEEEFSQ